MNSRPARDRGLSLRPLRRFHPMKATRAPPATRTAGTVTPKLGAAKHGAQQQEKAVHRDAESQPIACWRRELARQRHISAAPSGLTTETALRRPPGSRSRSLARDRSCASPEMFGPEVAIAGGVELGLARRTKPFTILKRAHLDTGNVGNILAAEAKRIAHARRPPLCEPTRDRR
jgi:hypothetical protein